MTTTNHIGLAATQRGRTAQITRAYLGQADDLKNRKLVQPADCDQPQTLEEALRVIVDLKNKLQEAEDQREADRAAAYNDAPVAVSAAKYWDTATVAKKSGNKAVSTICRNAKALGGIKLAGDWLFPEGTIYSGKRHRKAK